MGNALRIASAAVLASALLLAPACGAPQEDARSVAASAPAPASSVDAGASPETSAEGTSAPAGGPDPAAAPSALPAPASPSASDVGLAAEGLDPDLLSPSVTSEPEVRIVPLESLLRAPAPRPAPRVLDLRGPAESSAGAASRPSQPGVTDAVRDRVRVERRSERIGRVGPDQGTWSETEAGVDVPVGEGVKLRGGVRVEERDEPAEERRERESTPQVGVEIEF